MCQGITPEGRGTRLVPNSQRGVGPCIPDLPPRLRTSQTSRDPGPECWQLSWTLSMALFGPCRSFPAQLSTLGQGTWALQTACLCTGAHRTASRAALLPERLSLQSQWAVMANSAPSWPTRADPREFPLRTSAAFTELHVPEERRVGHLSQSRHPTKASLPLKSDPPHTDGTRGHTDVDKNSRLLGPCLSPAHQPADSCPGTAQSRVPGHGGTSTAHSRTSELQPQPISSSHGTTGLLLCSCVLEGNRWHTDRALRRD